MREIKFKGWSKNVKQMFEVVKINWVSCAVWFKDAAYIGNLGDHDIILLQYTGLKDKNGKEIYEGDILKLDGGGKPSLGSVGFERGCFVFNADWLNKEKEYMPELYRYTFFAELEKSKTLKDCIVVEIIGNIYENPELTKEAK